jgi:hypothetical protein
MKNPHDKYDTAMQEYARKWIRTLDRPHYSNSISIFFIAIFIFLWSSALTRQSGYTPLKGFGIIIFFSIIALFIFILIVMNTILAKIGFSRPIRAALWFSALIGPYISIVLINSLENPPISHFIGFVSSVLAFILSYSLDRVFVRDPTQIADES